MAETRSGKRRHPVGWSPTRLALRAVVIATAVLASVIAIVPFVDAAVPLDCSVEPAEGGVLLSWTEVPDAVSYQYKRDVAGAGSAYQRVTGSSAFIPLAEGLTATVGLSPIFADGSTQARTPCGSASPLEGTGPQPLTCSVASADGGIEVNWTEIDGAVEYAWKLTVEGFSPKYRRVKGTSAFISLSDGMVGSVSVTPVFADGSIRTRTECGSAAPNDGTGGGTFTCKVSSAPNGVLLEWTEVNAAVSYQYKSVVEGKGASYRRVTGASALIELASGTTTTVGLSPVFADGSTMPRTNCGTATAGGVVDPPDAPVIGTCGLSEPVDGTARFSWTAQNTDDVGSLTWKIVYTFSIPGETGSEVARSFDKDARDYDIAFAAAGTTVTGTIEIENVDGQVVSPAVQVDCGTIVVGEVDPPDAPVITSCGFEYQPDGTGNIVWTAENTGDLNITWIYNVSWLRPNYDLEESDSGLAFGADARSGFFSLEAGTIITASSLRIQSIDGQPPEFETFLDCGSTVVGGVPGAPLCRVQPFNGAEVFFFAAIYDVQGYEFVISYDNGDVETFPVAAAGTFSVPGRAGEQVDVGLRAILPDGSNSLTSNCGRATIPEDQGPALAIRTCSVVSTLTGPDVVWEATRPGNITEITWLAEYSATLPDGSVEVAVGRETNPDARNIFLSGLPVGTVVTVTVRVQDANGDPNLGTEPVDCGSGTAGGEGAGPECSLDGAILSYPESADFVDYSMSLNRPGQQPDVFSIVEPSPFDLVAWFEGRLSGTYEVVLHGNYTFNPGGPTSAGTLCGTINFDAGA